MIQHKKCSYLKDIYHALSIFPQNSGGQQEVANHQIQDLHHAEMKVVKFQ